MNKERGESLNNAGIVNLPEIGYFRIIPGTWTSRCIDARGPNLNAVMPKLLTGVPIWNKDVPMTPQEAGGVAFPGASLGFALVLYAANPVISPEGAVNLTGEWEQSRGRKVLLHTDGHKHENVAQGLGCGFADQAVKNTKRFVLPELREFSSEDVLKIVNYAIRYAQTPQKPGAAVVTELEGEHIESGIARVWDPRFTIESSDLADSRIQVFRDDRGRFYEKLYDFTDYARTRGVPDINFENMKKTADAQANATCELLAPGLAVYDIYQLGSSIPVIRKRNNIPGKMK